MYWWRVSKLAEDLREGRVEEKERLKYYPATSLLWTISSGPFLYYGRVFKITDVISAATDVAALIVGTILCYRANRAGDSTDFIGRMISLSWPIGFRLFVLYLAIGAVLIEFSDKIAAIIVDYFGVARVIVGALFEICFYWLLYKYVRLVAQSKEDA